MQELQRQNIDAPNFMDYTTVPAGWLIKGHLWTGQSTTTTGVCPECERIGVLSSRERQKRVVVHTGHVDDNTLVGIDYCETGN